jgi:hypothetical protein
MYTRLVIINEQFCSAKVIKSLEWTININDVLVLRYENLT